jgi:hypothetical protein
MKNIITRKIVFMLGIWGVLFPVFGAEGNSDIRNTPITVNLIIDGSSALSAVLDEVGAWVSDSMVDGILQNGDSLTIWSAGQSAQILYSQTLTNENERENIKKILNSLPANGDSADFAGALQNAASRNRSRICYTMLISASPAALSPALLGSSANLMRFSRIEEFRGWRAMIIGLDIDSRVRQAAAAYLSGL